MQIYEALLMIAALSGETELPATQEIIKLECDIGSGGREERLYLRVDTSEKTMAIAGRPHDLSRLTASEISVNEEAELGGYKTRLELIIDRYTGRIDGLIDLGVGGPRTFRGTCHRKF